MVVFVELQTLEGFRVKVLQRLSSEAGRALSYVNYGKGGRGFRFAEQGVVVAGDDRYSLPGPHDPPVGDLGDIADRFGVSRREIAPLEAAGSAVMTRLTQAGFGVRVDEGVLLGPAHEAALLPLLPDLTRGLRLPVNTTADAEFAAVVRSAPRDRSALAVRDVVTAVAAVSGLPGYPAVPEPDDLAAGLDEDSPLGVELRAWIAGCTTDGWAQALTGSVLGRQRLGRAIQIARTLPPQEAVPHMLSADLGIDTREVINQALTDVDVPSAILEEELRRVPARPPILLDLAQMVLPRANDAGRTGPRRAWGIPTTPPPTGLFVTDDQSE